VESRRRLGLSGVYSKCRDLEEPKAPEPVPFEKWYLMLPILMEYFLKFLGSEASSLGSVFTSSVFLPLNRNYGLSINH